MCHDGERAYGSVVLRVLAGGNRSLDYCPYPPGTGVWDFRPEAATWPGGGVDVYLDQVIPAPQQCFG